MSVSVLYPKIMRIMQKTRASVESGRSADILSSTPIIKTPHSNMVGAPKERKTMVTAVTIHALERLQERRGAVNLLKTIKKRREYPNGITEHKGWRYVVRKGVLVTVLPPKRSKNEEQA